MIENESRLLAAAYARELCVHDRVFRQPSAMRATSHDLCTEPKRTVVSACRSPPCVLLFPARRPIRLTVRTRPSQGRNEGSIPSGTAIRFYHSGKELETQGDTEFSVCRGVTYLGCVEEDGLTFEPVRFVGMQYADSRAVFEDLKGDLHIYPTEDVKVVA